MKILVVGCGSIGRRHIRLLKEMGHLPYGCDPSPHAKEWVENECSVNAYYPTVSSALESGHRWDGAIIATPNHLHLDPAMEFMLLAKQGLLVEKPLAHNLEHARAIATIANRRNVPVLVGYCLRHHPGLQRVKTLVDTGAIGKVRHASIHFGSYLPGWRPGFDYRQGYAASREQGGGILLDASHELDYACWLFGKPVSVMAQVQNTGALEIETEDVADVLVRFESGVQAVIHADYLDREYERFCHIIGDKASLTWAWKPRNDGTWLSALQQQPYTSGDPYEWVDYEPDDMYRAELRHFLAVLKGEETPACTGEDGLLALRLVEAARRSSEERRMITL